MGMDKSKSRYREDDAAKDAQDLLEGPLCRKRWTPEIRDRIASKLHRTVNRRIDEALEAMTGKS